MKNNLNTIYEIDDSELTKQIIEFDRCILCKSDKDKMTKEHIIPDSIGGKLQAKILCEKCNNDIGSKIYKELVDDILIREAIIDLRDQIPQVFDKFKINLDFEGISSDGRIVPMRYNNKGELKSKTLPAENDSVIYDMKISEKEIKHRLENLKSTKSDINILVEKWKNAPYNKRTTLSKGIDFIKTDINDINILYSGDRASIKVPMLISFEFLSLVIGERIFLKEFDKIRDFICGKEGLPDSIYINILRGEKYLPEISIYADDSEFGEFIKICVIFFNWLCLDVHYKNIKKLPYYPAFKQNLKSGKCYITANWKSKNKQKK